MCVLVVFILKVDELHPLHPRFKSLAAKRIEGFDLRKTWLKKGLHFQWISLKLTQIWIFGSIISSISTVIKIRIPFFKLKSLFEEIRRKLSEKTNIFFSKIKKGEEKSADPKQKISALNAQKRLKKNSEKSQQTEKSCKLRFWI